MKKIAVLFSGIGSNFGYLAQNLDRDNSNIKIVLALTNNPDAIGIEIAKKYNIALEIINSSDYHDREEFDAILVEIIKSHDVDLVVLAGFMRILTPVFTNNIKAINLHPSLLPRHKGIDAIKRSYEDEFMNGGVSVHWVDSELDNGEIILQNTIPKDDLSFDEYHNAIKELEKSSLLEAIKKTLK
jgi:phosphoribosylglycinamide formyltransferase-1